MMSTEDANVALVRRVFHEGTDVPNPPPVVREIFATDFMCHGPPGVNHSHQEELAGPEHCMLQDAFTDVSFRLEEVTTEGDHVKCHFVASLLQVADFQGGNALGEAGVLDA